MRASLSASVNDVDQANVTPHCSDTGVKSGLVTLNKTSHLTSFLDRQSVHSAVEAGDSVRIELIRRHESRPRLHGKVLLDPGVSEKFLL